MAGRTKEPIDLLIAKGKKHLTKKEIEERRSEELQIDLLNVKAPKYLTIEQTEEFKELADKLLHLKIMTELDEDALARYIVTKEEYLKIDSLLQKKLNQKRIDIEKLSELQKIHNRMLSQVKSLATDLGLTITSRCKVVMPISPTPPKKNKFLEKFGDK